MSEQAQTKDRAAQAGRYDPRAIEPKWQARWAADGLYRTPDDDPRPKWYALTMLPYTSGDLHIGHWWAMAPSDTQARFMRMRGHNVLFPMGFDAFGLPAENAAIKDGAHPAEWTSRNIERMRGQLKSMGAMFDWEREVITASPDYYRWSQWFFLKLLEHDLAYRQMAPVWWCPKDQTVLANEQVVGGECERCGTPVTKRDLEQWFFRITRYADELLDFSKMQWPEQIQLMQRNWIGRREGAELRFGLDVPGAKEKEVRVFTTRPDTVWGCSFFVLAPEHPLVDQITTAEERDAVRAYVDAARRQTEIERLSTEREKTGVFTGAYVTNLFNGEKVPVWTADYVLYSYGTGAVMGVGAHDERDFAFALKHGLPILPVIERPDGLTKSFAMHGTMQEGLGDALAAARIPFEERSGSLFITIPFDRIDRYVEISRSHLKPGCWNEVVGTRWIFIFDDGVQAWDSPEAERRILARCKALEPAVRERRTVMEMLYSLAFYRDALFHDAYGMMVHSGDLTDTPGDRAIAETIRYGEGKGYGKGTVNYRLRDWLISRQRMWGAPIPVVYCKTDGIVPVPEQDLPVLLPDDAEFRPTGESPLTYHQGFLNTTCPACGEPARRETDTMDTFMCSSWYQMRYIDPHNDERPFSRELARKWLPVDQYTGGAEHAVMHLLYTRFFTKAVRDMGLLEFDEPMMRLFNQGQILGTDGQRMSKSRGNVIAPDEQVEKWGADTFRAYLMFLGPWDEGGPYDPSGISGVARWLNRAWNIATADVATTDAPDAPETRSLRRWTHHTLQRVTHDIERFHFNTMVSALMEFTNELSRRREAGATVDRAAWREAVEMFVLMLAPPVPHIAEELWEHIGKPYSVHTQSWPSYDASLAAADEVEIAVQVNGRVRERLTLPVDAPEDAAKEQALASPSVRAHVEGKEIVRVIYVPNRLVNIVVKG
ncbi:MAG: leucine--tRNA ligase [Dehalococcoidia bacterium]